MSKDIKWAVAFLIVEGIMVAAQMTFPQIPKPVGIPIIIILAIVCIWFIVSALHHKKKKADFRSDSQTIGIKAEDSTEIKIENCTFENLGVAIQLANSDMQVKNLTMLDNQRGIVAKKSKVDVKGLKVKNRSEKPTSHREDSQT